MAALRLLLGELHCAAELFLGVPLRRLHSLHYSAVAHAHRSAPATVLALAAYLRVLTHAVVVNLAELTESSKDGNLSIDGGSFALPAGLARFCHRLS